MRSVHTLASVIPISGDFSALLASALPAGDLQLCFFTPSPSCPLAPRSLPLHRYYEALTPAPLPSGSEAGLLIDEQHFRTFVSNTLCAPAPAILHLRQASPRSLCIAIGGLRTSYIPSSLISRTRPYRVCVATPVGVAVYGLSVHFQCSPPVSPRRSYFQYPREARR